MQVPLSLLNHFAATCQNNSFFGLKPWYQYIEVDDRCNVINFHVLPTNGVSDIFLIALAVVDDMLRIAGYVAIGFLIYGGILYVMSQGSPDQTGKAQNTIINALIGLVVSIVAVALVSFIGNRVG